MISFVFYWCALHVQTKYMYTELTSMDCKLFTAVDENRLAIEVKICMNCKASSPIPLINWAREGAAPPTYYPPLHKLGRGYNIQTSSCLPYSYKCLPSGHIVMMEDCNSVHISHLCTHPCTHSVHIT